MADLVLGLLDLAWKEKEEKTSRQVPSMDRSDPRGDKTEMMPGCFYPFCLFWRIQIQKARRPTLLAGRVEVVGYENPLYIFCFGNFTSPGGSRTHDLFRLAFHPLTPSQSRLTTRVVR